jgi:hypothetical protein
MSPKPFIANVTRATHILFSFRKLSRFLTTRKRLSQVVLSIVMYVNNMDILDYYDKT